MRQRVIVSYIGDQFVVHDLDGNPITDRAVLEQLAFSQFSGFKMSEYVDVDIPDQPTAPLSPQVNIKPQ
jgi:hypothetical protein